MRWLIALKRKDTSGLSSPGYPVKTATGRIGDKQNGDTPKRRQPDRRQFGHNYQQHIIVEMAKKQQVKTATTIEEEEGREKKRREEEGRKIITQLSN